MGFEEPCFRDSDDDMIRGLLDSGHPFLEGITLEELDAKHSVRLRVGDPAEAERAIDEVLNGAALDPHERWPLLLLRAHVAVRRGAPEAGELAAQAFETCRELGHPEGPLIREAEISRRLVALAAQAGSRSATTLMRDGGTLSIQVLGGFSVARAGQVVELPAGRPAKAVRAVAVAGGRLHSEGLIEILWPEGDRAAGRNRLRNLLSRLRTAAGDLLVRDGETIILAAQAELDVQRFENQARAALAAGSAGDYRRVVVLGTLALESYGGELLPDDRYETWVVEPREHLRTLYLELLDLLAQAAAQRDEADEAARLLERAINAEPHDEQRYPDHARLAGNVQRHVHEHRAALHVPEEVEPEALAVARPGNEPGHVGDHELGVPGLGHAQVRDQRGKRVIRDLRPGRGQHSDERGLARIREPDQAGVGHGLELED